MFHDSKFLNRLDTTEGCLQRGYDAGHWLQITKAEEALADLQKFLSSSK